MNADGIVALIKSEEMTIGINSFWLAPVPIQAWSKLLRGHGSLRKSTIRFSPKSNLPPQRIRKT